MEIEAGQILRHCCKFPDEDEYEIARHFVLSVGEYYAKIYLLWHNVPPDRALPEPVGQVEDILIRCIESETETSNNFYWKIMS